MNGGGQFLDIESGIFFLFVLFFQKEKQTTRGNMATEENWEREKSRAKLVGRWLLKGG